MRAWLAASIRVALVAVSSAAWPAAAGEGGSLEDALRIIQAHRFVDLTPAFAPGIPHWKGAPDERVKTLYTVGKDGFRINEYCHIGSGARTSIHRRISTPDCTASIRSIRRTC